MSDRVYEILFIADPNLGEPEVDALTAPVQGYVEKEGGRIQKVEKWGKKRLAYMIGKHREGSYVLLVVEGPAALVQEVERRIRVTDGVVKFMTRARRRGADARPRAARRVGARTERPAAARRRSEPERGGAAVSFGGFGGGGGRAVGGRGGRERAPGGDKDKKDGQALLLPAPQGLQVLRGQDRLHRLQGREDALGLRPRARQGPSAADVRHLRRAPAQADPRDQAGAQHRAPALRGGVGDRGHVGARSAPAESAGAPMPGASIRRGLASAGALLRRRPGARS